ncbi:follistatin-related protein 5-like isoform X1 [Dysidea avara]|uniref:follistatin-related protein 5-like isoform X1 n=1 Tax=Dysidea avara TaxID=196820 RepID=UPI00333476BF
MDGSQDIVRCQNRSDDGETFYSYIITAVWYRYMMMERMSSLIALDEGQYCCCTHGDYCSRATNVTKSIPPIIRPVNSYHTAEGGSQATLACSIINQGVPIAQFRWLRNGIDLNGENIFTNNTFT